MDSIDHKQLRLKTKINSIFDWVTTYSPLAISFQWPSSIVRGSSVVLTWKVFTSVYRSALFLVFQESRRLTSHLQAPAGHWQEAHEHEVHWSPIVDLVWDSLESWYKCSVVWCMFEVVIVWRTSRPKRRETGLFIFVPSLVLELRYQQPTKEVTW